jgi:hypothetical protein
MKSLQNTLHLTPEQLCLEINPGLNSQGHGPQLARSLHALIQHQACLMVVGSMKSIRRKWQKSELQLPQSQLPALQALQLTSAP